MGQGEGKVLKHYYKMKKRKRRVKSFKVKNKPKQETNTNKYVRTIVDGRVRWRLNERYDGD